MKDGKVVYEEIDSIPNISKVELYNKSKIWLVNTFNDAKAVLQIDDKDNGQLIGKGNFDYLYTVVLASARWVCNFTVQIDCRDNKARIKVYDISSRSAGEATAEYFNKHHANKHIKAIDDGVKGLLASYKSALSKKAEDNF
jgi:hypothetical protein